MESLGPEILKLVQIIWINIILSGDNAVVIAMACRGLPQNKQRAGMVLGAFVAVALRIVFTVLVASLLSTPFLKILGGCLLLWIAVKLIVGEDEHGGEVKETDRLGAMAAELRKLGAQAEEGPDWLRVEPPSRFVPAKIRTYDDHRMAMCFSLAALAGVPVTIEDPGCVRKTFPSYFTELTRILS